MITIEHKSDLTHFGGLNEQFVTGMLVSCVDYKESIGMIVDLVELEYARIFWAVAPNTDLELRHMHANIRRGLGIPREFLPIR